MSSCLCGRDVWLLDCMNIRGACNFPELSLFCEAIRRWAASLETACRLPPLVVLAIDRRQSARTMPGADLALPNLPRSIALRMDPVRGRATHAYIACDGGVLAIVDVRNPVLPRLISSEQVLADQRKRQPGNEVIDINALDLPRTQFTTQALWYELD